MAYRLITSKTKANFVKRGESFFDDVYNALVEVQKLTKYYQTEVAENKKEMAKMKASGKHEEFAYYRGKMEAYTDHTVEIAYISEMVAGLHHDIEKQSHKSTGDVEREVMV